MCYELVSLSASVSSFKIFFHFGHSTQLASPLNRVDQGLNSGYSSESAES